MTFYASFGKTDAQLIGTHSVTNSKAKLRQAVCSGVKITLIFKPLTYTGTPLIK